MRAIKLGGIEEILQVNDCPYRLSMGDGLVHLRSITVSQRVHLTRKELPLQMWTSDIVEQILPPYCALEYTDQETRAMDDPSGFTCIVFSQKTIPIPDSIKVPENGLLEGSDLQSAPTSLFLNKHTVFLDKTQYLHGITKRYRYKSALTAASARRIASPAECFI